MPPAPRAAVASLPGETIKSIFIQYRYISAVMSELVENRGDRLETKVNIGLLLSSRRPLFGGRLLICGNC